MPRAYLYPDVLPRHPRRIILCAGSALALAVAPAPLASQNVSGSQDGRNVGGRSEVFAGGELENYLRYLQTIGAVGAYPWSLRAFSPAEVDSLVPRSDAHPWAARYDLAPRANTGFRFDVIRPSLNLIENTGFPYGSNDGPVWAGKGITTVLQFGFSARYGPISLTVAPEYFRAGNAAFRLMPNGKTGSLAFADGRYPTVLDRPQRFGDGPYARLDPGQSELRIDLAGLTAGISTAEQWWGPASQHPLILGNNAAGFPHLFFGTARPRDLWFAKVHVRFEYGDLRQSGWSSVTGPPSRRFFASATGVIQPRGLSGLELGVARLFVMPWPSTGLTWHYFAKPFESFLRVNLPPNPDFPKDPNQSIDDQVASAFARWVLPHSGFEVYAEFGREDHSWDLRDLALEPDHSSAYTIGFRKVWPRADGSFVALRAEAMDAQPSNLDHIHQQGVWYTHSNTRQGVTELGQLLGSADATGGQGSIVALDVYGPRGRWTFSWSRDLRGMLGQYQRTSGSGAAIVQVYGPLNPRGLDVVHTIGADALIFAGLADITAGVAFAYDFNRDFRSDLGNLNVHLGATVALQARPTAPRIEEVPNAAAAPDSAAAGPAWLARGFVPDSGRASSYRVATLGGPEDDRARLAQLLGAAPAEGRLLRRPTGAWQALPGDSRSVRWAWVAPEIALTENTTFPYSLNDGAMWAGRGVSTGVTGGIRAEWASVTLTLAPQLLYSENRPFALPDASVSLPIPPGRSPFSSPYHIRPYSADLPIRFGDRAITRLDLGQSTLAIRAGGTEFGASTENEWWGPGIRNAIVMSDQAAGIPRLFVRSARPLRTRAGTFEGILEVGGLSESRFFDTTATNDLRSLSALAVTWSPPGESGLTLGLARAVYGPVGGWSSIPGRLFDVFTFTGRPNDKPLADSSQTPGRDQLYSLFGRWVFPKDGLETWFEWARAALPASLRDLLTAPSHTQGYTLGLQWARPVRSGAGVLRLQGELTNLERNASYHDRPEGTWYTSRAVIQGYTQMGQVIGAGIGPGASSEWLAVDYLAPRWSAGAFVGRIRWENDALYEVKANLAPYLNLRCSQDVSLLGGLRGTLSGRWGLASASVTLQHRMAMYFEYDTYCDTGVDFSRTNSPDNATFEVRFSPRIP